MWRIHQHTNCNKRRQTSRSVVKVKIQTDRYFQSRSSVRNNFVDYQHCICHDLFMEQAVVLCGILRMASAIVKHLIMLLLENLRFSSPSASSNTRFPGESWCVLEHGTM